MGRVQTFDRDAVTRAAREVFWEHGYEAASVPVLEEATGLKRSSIYHAFGSKRGLFDAAVENYLDEVIRPRLQPLKMEIVQPDALKEYLTGLRTALTRGGSFVASNGCLLINSAGSHIGHDEAVREVVAGYRHELKTSIARGVRAKYPRKPEPQRESLAEAVTALVVAAFALTRVDNAGAVASLDAGLGLVG